MRRTLSLLLPALLLGAASCDLVGPDDFALPGTYLLTSVDRVTLPALLVDEPDLEVAVWGVTLWLESNGTYRSRVELLIDRGDTTVVSTVRGSGDFRRDGDVLLLEHGTVEQDGAELEILNGHALREITSLDRVLRYERVTPRR